MLDAILNKNTKKKLAPYTAICAEYQGIYRVQRIFMHGGYAQTYSKEFVEASSSIYVLLACRTDKPIRALSELFTSNQIKSCKGLEMTEARVRYLYDNFIQRHLDSRI